MLSYTQEQGVAQRPALACGRSRWLAEKESNLHNLYQRQVSYR